MWIVSFQTSDIDVTIENVVRLGGKVIHPANTVPDIGRTAWDCRSDWRRYRRNAARLAGPTLATMRNGATSFGAAPLVGLLIRQEVVHAFYDRYFH